MQYVEIHNPDRQLLEAWMARQLRQRKIMIQRQMIPWYVRRYTPEVAQSQLSKIDAALKRNAHDYWDRGTPR